MKPTAPARPRTAQPKEPPDGVGDFLRAEDLAGRWAGGWALEALALVAQSFRGKWPQRAAFSPEHRFAILPLPKPACVLRE